MNYFLFLNHPKGEEVYKVSKKREEILREHFKRVSILQTTVEIRGKKYNAIVDYSAFSNLGNFDCFNCQDPCCADNPTIYEKQTRDFVIENLEEYNELTKNVDIMSELGYELSEIKESIKNDTCMVPDENVENEISLCTCSYKNKENIILCSLHSICLEQKKDIKTVVETKPIVCSLWPIDIISEEDNSMLYITIPDDFTTGFTIEDYYDTPCINLELSQSSVFRRKNPNGFKEEDYKPIIVAYENTLKYSLGEKFFYDVKKKLIEEELVFEEEFYNNKEQISKKIE